MRDSLYLPGGYKEKLTLREEARAHSDPMSRCGILGLVD